MPAAYPVTDSDLGTYVSRADAVSDLGIDAKNDPVQAKTLDEFYSRSFAAVQDLQVDVDGDPIKRGLFVFHSKTSDLRRYQNFVVRLIFIGIRIRNKTHSNFLLAKEIFEQEVRGLIVPMPDWETNDDGKKSRLSADTKRLRAELELEESRRKLQELETQYLDAKSFVEAMTLLKDNFKNTRDDLLFSMSAIRSQMLIGEVSVNVNTNLAKKVEKELLDDRLNVPSSRTEAPIQEGEVSL